MLFSFCAVERHDTDPSKPGQSAEKSELPPIRRSCGADAGRRANRESRLIPPRVGNITRISFIAHLPCVEGVYESVPVLGRFLQNGAAQAPCRSVSCAPVDSSQDCDTDPATRAGRQRTMAGSTYRRIQHADNQSDSLCNRSNYGNILAIKR